MRRAARVIPPRPIMQYQPNPVSLISISALWHAQKCSNPIFLIRSKTPILPLALHPLKGFHCHPPISMTMWGYTARLSAFPIQLLLHRFCLFSPLSFPDTTQPFVYFPSLFLQPVLAPHKFQLPLAHLPAQEALQLFVAVGESLWDQHLQHHRDLTQRHLRR